MIKTLQDGRMRPVIKVILCVVFALPLCLGAFEVAHLEHDLVTDSIPSLGTISEETLIVFDVDDVLIVPKDLSLKQGNKHAFGALAFQFLAGRSMEEINDLSSTAILDHQVQLLDAQILETLEGLEVRGARLIALTAASTGKLGKVDRLEHWRFNQLRELGIDFSKHWDCDEIVLDQFPNLDTLDFNGVPNADERRPPSFYRGILFSAKHPKGEVLHAFLQRCGSYPRSIVFFDDARENLTSVAKMCHTLGIAYTGVLITGATSEQLPPFDEKIAKLQLKLLEDQRRWVSEEELNQQMHVWQALP